MTVAELIAKLTTADPTALVLAESGDDSLGGIYEVQSADMVPLTQCG